MNKNGNDIFVGEFNVSNDKCDGDERSESSSDSSSSEERYKKDFQTSAKGSHDAWFNDYAATRCIPWSDES